MSKWLVVDKRRVSWLVAQLVDRVGSQVAAGRRLGCSQEHVGRLARGVVPAQVEARLVAGLRRSALVHERVVLRTAVLDPKSTEEMHRYDAWLTREMGRPRRRLLAKLETQVEANGLAALVRAFRRGLHGIDQRRVDLAVYRALQPLHASREAGPVEQQVGELSDAQLRAYVRASLQRERILLAREADDLRVPAVADVLNAEKTLALVRRLNIGQAGLTWAFEGPGRRGSTRWVLREPTSPRRRGPA